MLLAGPAANFLVKELESTLQSGKASLPELAYLTRHAASEDPLVLSRVAPRSIGKAEVQLQILGHRASRLVRELHQLRASPCQEDGVPSLSSQLEARLATRASKAHGAYFILHSFISTIESLRRTQGKGMGATISPGLLDVLDKVRSLYAIETCILAEVGDYTEDGFLSQHVLHEAERESARLMAELRPDILGLVEAADMTDWYLASPLGSSDGRAYERLVEFMKSEPLNQPASMGDSRDENGVLLGFRQVLGRLTHGEVEGWNEAEAKKREEERRIERLAKL